ALGMATAPVIKDLTASVMLRIDAVGAGLVAPANGGSTRDLARVRAALESRGRTELESEGFSLHGLTVRTILDMRYAGQSYELPIATDSLEPVAFLPLFNEAHHSRYGHSDPSRPVEVVNLRLKLILPGPTGGAQRAAPARRRRSSPAPAATRDVWFDRRPMSTAIYDRGDLRPGHSLSGPALVTQMDSTTVAPPGWHAVVDAWLNLLLEPA
ncbi:MAG TPA: hydantoinase/oxoprolinase family protein, partial [Dehalococcoidia bacterium]|nr:hydantoinase/oxoprolinase family protein [Dehalococcoidia bacterium]